MPKPSAILLVVIGLTSSFAATAAQRFPWSFGMTPEQVQAVTDYGPYRSFSNGDLETYNGILDGRKQDFQFFFREGKLIRIGVDLYEGPELSTATAQWWSLYKWMKKQFGDMETPGSEHPAGDGQRFRAAAQSEVQAGSKPQMAPVTQPDDVFAFASWKHQEVEGRTYYFIFLYFDPPHS